MIPARGGGCFLPALPLYVDRSIAGDDAIEQIYMPLRMLRGHARLTTSRLKCSCGEFLVLVRWYLSNKSGISVNIPSLLTGIIEAGSWKFPKLKQRCHCTFNNKQAIFLLVAFSETPPEAERKHESFPAKFSIGTVKLLAQLKFSFYTVTL